MPSATAGFRAKYLASSGAKLLLLRYRPSDSAFEKASQVSSSVVSVRMVLAARGARGRSALIMGGVTLVRTRDSKLALALTAK